MLKNRQQAIKDILSKRKQPAPTASPDVVQHFSSGGFLQQGLDMLGGGVGNALGGVTKAITPQNNYQASSPDVNNINPQSLITNGQNGVGSAQSQLGSLEGLQTGIADQQGSIAQKANIAAGGYNGILGQQQGLADQLLAQSQGQGPNPAQAQFQQNLNASTANAAGTIASQKGISPALAASLIANQQGAAGQNAAGQAATLQAQQQIAAQQQLQAQQSAMGNTLGQQQNAYGNASSIYGQQANTVGAAGNLANAQGNLGMNQLNAGLGVNNAQNQLASSNSLGVQQINSGVKASNVAANQKVQGGIVNGVTGAGATAAFGGNNNLSGGGGSSGPAGDSEGASGASGAGLSSIAAMAYDGGQIKSGPVPLVNQSKDQVAAQASPALSQALMARGGQVPGDGGENVPGNSIKNDRIPAVLSADEIVLPRDVTMSNDPAQKAAEFVEALKGHTQPGYAKVIEARKKHAEAMAAYKGGKT